MMVLYQVIPCIIVVIFAMYRSLHVKFPDKVIINYSVLIICQIHLYYLSPVKKKKSNATLLFETSTLEGNKTCFKMLKNYFL